MLTMAVTRKNEPGEKIEKEKVPRIANRATIHLVCLGGRVESSCDLGLGKERK